MFFQPLFCGRDLDVEKKSSSRAQDNRCQGPMMMMQEYHAKRNREQVV